MDLTVDPVRQSSLKGDLWGGVSAMLVALPSSIAYGVTIMAVLGSSHLAQGAVAGVIGAVSLGLVAACFGSARQLISAPCAPAAAMLSALCAGFLARGQENADPATAASRVLLLLTLVSLFSAAIQIGFGIARGGRLIKYIPYPVVAGYLSGVGLMIMLAQAPKLFGFHAGPEFWQGLLQPGRWNWPSLGIGVGTIVGMTLGPRLVKGVPAAVLGLLGGILTFASLALIDPSLRSVSHNPLLVGPVQGNLKELAGVLADRWRMVGALSVDDLLSLCSPAFTLATLLSIDTLKTCVVLDAMTGHRTDSNRELMAQGAGNLLSAVFGGTPGAGTMGPTLLNLNSGGQTRRAGMISACLILVAFLFGRSLIALIPTAGLAGILIVLGSRMIDRESFQLLRHRDTILDFAVVLTVVVVALVRDLITAAGVGIALALALFIRNMINGSVIRRKLYGDKVSSSRQRHTAEKAVLIKQGRQMVLCELQGSLFFGTTDQLLTELDVNIRNCRFILLDMRRVQSFDFTAGHVLHVIFKQVKAHDGYLLLCSLPTSLPTGNSLFDYLEELGILKGGPHLKIFDNHDEAIEWVENQILSEVVKDSAASPALIALDQISLFSWIRSEEVLGQLRSRVVERCYKAGETIFHKGDTGDAVYIIRSGSVSVNVPLETGHRYHLTTFSEGHFFGDMAFLDGQPRSADAVAVTETHLFALPRSGFDELATSNPAIAVEIMQRLCCELAIRLRYSNNELRAMHEL